VGSSFRCFWIGDTGTTIAVFGFHAKGPHDAENPFHLMSVGVTQSSAMVQKPARTLPKPDPLWNTSQSKEYSGAKGFMGGDGKRKALLP
jgi:hypothetical protein